MSQLASIRELNQEAHRAAGRDRFGGCRTTQKCSNQYGGSPCRQDLGRASADTAGEKLRGQTGRARAILRHLNSGKREGGMRGGAGTKQQRDGDQDESITARASCD